MARTQRNQTFNYFRKPKTFNLIQNIKGLLADIQAHEFDYSISKLNRHHRYIPDAYDDLYISSHFEYDSKHNL